MDVKFYPFLFCTIAQDVFAYILNNLESIQWNPSVFPVGVVCVIGLLSTKVAAFSEPSFAAYVRVNGRTVVTLRIVHYIVGVRC